MYKFTVLTPTYNRGTLLCRLYNSLVKQSYKDFLWLIIDDGSTDDTKELVNNWKKDNIIPIEYHYKENGGKHTALKVGVDLIYSPYMIDIDSDDELTEDCLEVFNNEWVRLEKEERNDIGSIRALSRDDYGQILGTYDEERDFGSLDTSFNEMHFIKHRFYENITSNKTEILKKANIFDDSFWLDDRTKNINPGLFWMRLSKHTNTRYLFQVLRLYHYDAPESLIRVKKKNYPQMWLNRFVTIKLTLEEFGNYFWNYPWYFIKDFLYMGVYSKAISISTKEFVKNCSSKTMNTLYIILTPLFYMGVLILKLKTKIK